MTPVWTKLVETSRLAELGRDIARELQGQVAGGGEFCLWLEGPLGAGKTTLTAHILRALGLAASVPVTSPTYTYMNEYRVEATPGVITWYAHLDLYRMTGAHSAEELGLLDARPFKGVFVEWPERLPGDPGLRPTHRLSVGYTDDDGTRSFTLVRV